MKDEDILALDAKLNLEDNALFCHPELTGLAAANEQGPLELEANRHGLNYTRLEGNIGVTEEGLRILVQSSQAFTVRAHSSSRTPHGPRRSHCFRPL